MKTRIVIPLVLAALAVLAFGAAATAGGANGNHDSYDFEIGVVPDIEGPDVAIAVDGSTVTLTGAGTFTAGPSRSASGGGTYTLKNAAGETVGSGTWTVTGMLGFVSYGNAVPEGLPDFPFGGEAKFQVSLSNGSDGILTVFCLLGVPPAGKDEGVSLILGNGGNYTKQAGGQTVFAAA
jgi:hypothetical protein